jgi:peptide methionine sulfoxide reductase msrA/msrB
MLKGIFLGVGIAVIVIFFLLLVNNKVSYEGSIPEDSEENQAMRDYVTKQGGTEPAFQNEYWDEKRPGIYVDYNTGEPLFSSLDKYDSGTGWPSFTKPINDSVIKNKTDKSFGMERTEVKTDSSHLGHVFDDGPDGGSRFCINSAALEFIPYEELEKQGYVEYKELFPYEEAILAGGCFWGVESLLEETEGILNAVSGYTGGNTENPTYQEISSGKTGHAEAVLVVFDPEIISYSEILDLFWRLHNPTQINRQGVDVGTQYRSAIFYIGEEQKNIALQSKLNFNEKGVFKKPAATEIVAFNEFYKAEEYHQNYVENHPGYVCHELRGE